MPCKGIVLKKKSERERAGAGDIRDVIVKAIPVTCRCRFQYETLAQWPFFLCVPRPTGVQIATTASLICRRSSVGTSRGHGPTFTLHRWRSCRWKPISQTTETLEDSIKLRTINSFRKYLQSKVKLFKKKWTINQLLLSDSGMTDGHSGRWIPHGWPGSKSGAANFYLSIDCPSSGHFFATWPLPGRVINQTTGSQRWLLWNIFIRSFFCSELSADSM